MGLFNKFKDFQSTRAEKKNAKNLKVIQNSKAIKEDRTAALYYFKEHDDPEIAIPALLARFDYSLEHGINDSREKDMALAGILKHEERAIAPVKAHLSHTPRVAWPIKILGKLLSEDELAALLESCLDYGDISFDQLKVDRNYDILCYLVDYKIPGIVDRINKFLKDPDERVRFACVEVMVQQDEENLHVLLEPFLSDDTAENRRIRATVIDAFIRNNWRVADSKAFADGPLVEGVFVTKKGKVERRS